MTSAVALSEVCEITMGQAPSGESYNTDGEGLPLIAGAGDFGDLYPASKKYTTEASKVCEQGDVVLGIRATIGEKVIADGRYCLGRGVAGLRPRNGLDGRYLWHWLTHINSMLVSKARGATFLQVNKSDIGELPITLPALPEQRRIAAILDKADALRTKRREALAQLDTLTQSIFVEMFGDPVTGPIGCTKKRLADCVSKLEYGPRFYNEAYSSDGVRIVRITDLDHSGALDFDSMPRMTVDEPTKKQFTLQPGEVVFARTGATVGKVALIRESDPPSIAGAYFIRLRFDESLVPLYAYSVLRAQSVQALIEKKSRQAAQQNFSGPGLRALPMPVPPMSQQMAFESRVEKIHVEREKFAASLTEMDSLFASLQHRAFRGEL